MLLWVLSGLSHGWRHALSRPARRWLRRNRWTITGALVGLTALLLPFCLAFVHPPGWKSRVALADAPVKYLTTMVLHKVNRKVYPYSIVPGGADSVLEAKQAMSNPLLREQYAEFDLSRLREETLKTNLTGYVSYRWGDEIYWTAKMLTLRAGEKVFTDGVHIARGRCLNCYSTRKMGPTRTKEPTEKVLDTPVEMPVMAYAFPRIAIPTPQLPPPLGELTPTVPVLPAVPGAIAKTGRFWFPLVPIIPPIHRHHGPSPNSPGSPFVPPPVPVPTTAIVPEPRYEALALFGLLAAVLIFQRRRRAKESVNSR